MKIRFVTVITVIILLAGCAQATQTGYPEWVNKLIEKFESESVGNPPLSIWRYEYSGQVVYFVPAHCCDITSTLYDASGNVLCEPDGGIAGKGDGRCPNFYSERANEQLIWKDARTH
jgi:hypothetical protein